MKLLRIICLLLALTAAGAGFFTASAQERAADRPSAAADTLAWSPFFRCDPVLSGIRLGTSLGLNAAITEVLKNSVHEMRPDRSSNNSFPSRHTSWAYALGAMASNELYAYSPWWPLGFHAASAFVGLQRSWTNRHFPSDVLAGAAIGIGSSALGAWLGDFFYSGRFRSIWPSGGDEEFRASLDVSTEAIFPVAYRRSLPGGRRVHLRTGFGTAFSFVLPVSDRFGFLAVARAQSLAAWSSRTADAERYDGSLNLMALSLGAVARLTADGRSPFALDASLAAGVAHIFRQADYPSASFMLNAALSASWRITDAFACGLSGGYQLTTASAPLSAMMLALFTRAVF